jgi:hypothetical protein
MASLPKFVVILAILILPSRLLSQVRETSEQKPSHQPAPAAAVLGFEEVQADDLCCDRPWWHAFCRLADSPPCGPPRQSVFIFGGWYTTGSMGKTLFEMFNVTYDGNYPIALGYQRYHWTTGRFHWGWEVGVAGRFGSAETVEVWGGPTVRHEGIVLANRFMIKPSLTAGFSAVSEPMGRELVREYFRKGDATFLYYLGPDFAISSLRHPNLELFYRLHHRCGGGRTLGNLSEGNNANCIGLRLRF